MTGLQWYLRRVGAMSIGELRERARDELVRTRWRRRTPAAPMLATTPCAPPGQLERPVGSPAGRQELLDAVDAIRESGSWLLFGHLRDDLSGGAPDWFLDVSTGSHAPSAVHAFSIDQRDPDVVGNAKFVWELSRHHHLTALGAAWWLTADDRYARLAVEHLHDWMVSSPFLVGVHWTSPIESAMRLISWSWLRRLLGDWDDVERYFEASPVFIEQVGRHQQFLSSFRSHGSSSNNHLIAELVGSWVGACAFDWFVDSPAWRSDAAAALVVEAQRQTFSSGLNREQATAYHGFVLELLLAARAEAALSSQSLGPEFDDVIQRMLSSLAAIVDESGAPPRQGDTDDAHVVLIDSPNRDRWSSVLSIGSVFGELPSWWPERAREPGDVYSTVVSGLLAGVVGDNAAFPHLRPATFHDAGMTIIRSEDIVGTPELWCRVDHGPHGWLRTAAHAHADALAVELRIGGVEILADPGTFTYQGDPEWRRWFRSTIAHNTIELFGQDQSQQQGDFLWGGRAEASTCELLFAPDGRVRQLTASHDGYASRGGGHKRTVALADGGIRLLIVDEVSAPDGTAIRSAFHLGPSVTATRLAETIVKLSWRGRSGEESAIVQLAKDLTWSIVDGEEDPIMGWNSPEFGVRVPSQTLIGEGTQRDTVTRFVTEFSYLAAESAWSTT